MDAASLGNLLTGLQIVAMLGGGLYFIWAMKAELHLLRATQTVFIERLDKVENKIESLTSIIIQIAKQEERMDAADKRLQELSNRLESYAGLVIAPAAKRKRGS